MKLKQFILRKTKKKISIDLDNHLGKGGEGYVYDVNELPDLCAKIYIKDPSEYEKKLEAMLKMKTKVGVKTDNGHINLAWPDDLLDDMKNNFAGFVMPKINNKHNIFDFFTSEDRPNEFTWKHSITAAANLSKITGLLHSVKVLICDLNERNIKATEKGLISLMDCDSFQIVDSNGNVYYSYVGTDMYNPPEHQLLKKGTNVKKSIHSDSFSLAIIIFQLLMDGFHPFQGTWSKEGTNPHISIKIKKGWFTYFDQFHFTEPSPRSPSFGILPSNIQELFTTCFSKNINEPTLRPSPKQWYDVLINLNEKSLVFCNKQKGHVYSNHLTYCPWCDPYSNRQHFTVKKAVTHSTSAYKTTATPHKQVTKPSRIPMVTAFSLCGAILILLFSFRLINIGIFLQVLGGTIGFALVGAIALGIIAKSGKAALGGASLGAIVGLIFLCFRTQGFWVESAKVAFTVIPILFTYFIGKYVFKKKKVKPIFLYLVPFGLCLVFSFLLNDALFIKSILFTPNLFATSTSKQYISRFAPTKAKEGDTVIIYGKNLTGVNAVRFGGTDAKKFNVNNSKIQIRAVVGPGSSGNVEVSTLYDKVSLPGFTFIPPPTPSSRPTIIDFTPTSAKTGDVVNIKGKNLDGVTYVKFGGTVAKSFTIVSDSKITAIVGSGSSGNVSVTNTGGTSNHGRFVFITPFTETIITNFSPTYATIGDTVIIRGRNLNGATAVYFGGTETKSFTIVSDSKIMAIVGYGSSGSVEVSSLYDKVSLPGFKFIPSLTPSSKPTIIDFTPTSAKTGDTVNIKGKNLDGATAVYFGGTEAKGFTIVSDSKITAIVGSGSSGQLSIITLEGNTASQSYFSYIASERYTVWYNMFEGLTLSETMEGVTIFDIKRNCPTKKAGIEKGDVIIKIDGKNIKNMEEFIRVSGVIKHNKTEVSLLIKRHNRTFTKTIKSTKTYTIPKSSRGF